MASKESKAVSKKSKRSRDEKEDNGTTDRRQESDKNETVSLIIIKRLKQNPNRVC